MAGFFSKLFGGSKKTPAQKLVDPEAAVAALLVEAALVDGIYADLESDRISMILLESFGFDADRADKLLAEGEARLPKKPLASMNLQSTSRNCRKISG